MKSNLLAEVVRGELQEKRFYGWVSVFDSNANLISGLEYNDYNCFMRSCEKPIQQSALINFDGIDKYKLDQKDIAIGFASHSGARDHIDLLESLLIKTGVNKYDLQCGLHQPFDKNERYRLIRENLEPDVLHNNCSAKHIFIVATCLINGWSIYDYIDFNHPVQKYINELIEKFCKPEKMYLANDGCGMPVHGMKLSEMGAGFAKFFDGNYKEANIIADAVTKYPYLAGAKGRIDSSIIKVSEGKLIAKVGAEGLLIVTPVKSGESLVVKVSDGDNNIRNYIVIEALKQLGWLEPTDELLFYTQTDIYSHNNKKVAMLNFKFKL